jgi:FkbM family methyltransferase
VGIKSRLRKNPLARSAREFLSRVSSIADSPFKSVVQHLKESNVSSVLDVGANVGQFGLDIRRHGFQGQIISYEPVKETFAVLAHTALKHQPWKAMQIGMGATESESSIYISGNAGLSSSLLQIGPIHLTNFPESATISTQKVLISTVDRQIDLLGVDPKTVMLKLDVQGYESEVLKGAPRYLSEIPLCYLEVSMISLYEGEITFLPILNMLSESGHQVIDVFRGLKTKKGQLLQLDVLTRLINT